MSEPTDDDMVCPDCERFITDGEDCRCTWEPDPDDVREGREEIQQAIREAEESAAHFAAKAKECEEAFDRFKEAAEQFIREAAAADTPFVGCGPRRVDPWEDR